MKRLDLNLYHHEKGFVLSDVTRFSRLPKLVELTLRNDKAPQLTDSDYEAIAAAMPRLEVLVITPDPHISSNSENNKSSATLSALFHIASHCPDIKRLGLFLDTSTESLQQATTVLSSRRRSQRLSISCL